MNKSLTLQHHEFIINTSNATTTFNNKIIIFGMAFILILYF